MAKNKKLIVGNWKMNPTTLEKAKGILSAIDKKVKKEGFSRVQAVICPPAIFLGSLSPKKVFLGAQDVFYEASGAHTGEISPAMLADFDIGFAIIGHSERRAQGETDAIVAQKVKSALSFGITPILCVGESSRDEKGKYLHFLKEEIKMSLSAVSKNAISKIVIAYEPIWAIGKDAVREATPEESEEMAIFIKKVLSDIVGGAHKDVRILYGGSVTAQNAEHFLSKGGVDGLLVGRESLNPKNFLEILRTAQTI